MSCFFSVLPERSVGPRSSHTQCHVIYVGHVVISVGRVGPKWVVSSICASVLFSSGRCDLFWEVIFAERFFILRTIAELADQITQIMSTWEDQEMRNEIVSLRAVSRVTA